MLLLYLHSHALILITSVVSIVLIIYGLPAYCNMYLCVRNIKCLHVLMIRIANCFPSIWRLMWALLHQMAERKSPRVCSYTSWRIMWALLQQMAERKSPRVCSYTSWRPMQALLLQMAERKSPRLCSYRSWVSQNENPIFLSLVSLNFLCFECQTSCLNILCLGCLTSCKSWIADLNPQLNF